MTRRDYVSRLPPDLMVSIFIKLSPRDLLISMGVCKSWRAVIRDSSFAHMHLQQSRQAASLANEKACLIIQSSEYLPRETHYPELSGSCCVKFTFDDVCYNVENSCDGLVLLSAEGLSGELLLWNPAIRKIKVVPPCALKDKIFYWKDASYVYWCGMPYWEGFVGMGCIEYDNKFDYKIVLVLYFHGGFSPDETTCVMVYSLSSNSWRRIGAIPYCQVTYSKSITSGVYKVPTYPGYCAVVLNDSVHWPVMCGESGEWEIMGFDFKEERFWHAALPETANEDCNYEHGLVLLVSDGLLSLVTEYTTELGWVVEIWVMKEHRVADSRTQLVVVGPHLDKYVEQVRCMKSKKFLLEGRIEMAAVCPSDSIHLPDIKDPYDLTTYLESLALLDDDQSFTRNAKVVQREELWKK